MGHIILEIVLKIKIYKKKKIISVFDNLVTLHTYIFPFFDVSCSQPFNLFLIKYFVRNLYEFILNPLHFLYEILYFPVSPYYNIIIIIQIHLCSTLQSIFFNIYSL